MLLTVFIFSETRAAKTNQSSTARDSSRTPFLNGHTAVSILIPFSNKVFLHPTHSPKDPEYEPTSSCNGVSGLISSEEICTVFSCTCSAFPEWLAVSVTVLGAVGYKVDVPQLFPKLTGQIGFLHHVPYALPTQDMLRIILWIIVNALSPSVNGIKQSFN